ncbi:MAG: hypothetical protein QW775_00665 [Ignisphaera sp.]
MSKESKALILLLVVATLASTWRKLNNYINRDGNLYVSFLRGLRSL